MLYTAQRYQMENGEVPYTHWINALRKRDRTAAIRVDLRIARAVWGNFGDCRYIRDGVWELKIDSGPGYRVYYSVE